MAFCSQCGARYDEGANFCPTCGRPVTAGAVTAGLVANQEGVEVVEPRLKTGVPDFVRDALHPAESVLGAFNASLFDHRRSEQLRHDKYILTSERIILYHTSLIHKGMAEMPYKMITEVSYNRGVFHGKVVIEAANAGLTIEGIGNDDAGFTEKVVASCVAGRKLVAAPPAR